VTRLLLALDPAFVVLFVAVGRDAHNEESTVGAVLSTATPFLIALTAGWTAARAWRDPTGLTTGAIVAAVTLLGGMLLRNLVFGDGTDPAFVLVAALFLAMSLIGWRWAAKLAGR
jgi:hypothetical protein